ncbi:MULTISPECIES: hypothetical protein [unclassified Myroides]
MDRSYVVRLDQIDTIERNRLFIGKRIIPVGKTYIEQFRGWIKSYQ